MKDKNVILLTIECLRSDHTDLLGYQRETTPTLKDLAEEGLNFTNAFSVSPWTPLSFTAILTSTYPLLFNGVVNPLQRNRVSIAEILQENGYKTISLAGGWLDPLYNYTRGFDSHNKIDTTTALKLARYPAFWYLVFNRLSERFGLTNTYRDEIYRRARFQDFEYSQALLKNRRALIQIKENLGQNQFLWIHYSDSHPPWYPARKYHFLDTPSNYEKAKVLNERVTENILERRPGELDLSEEELKKITALYDGEIRIVDKAIKRLIRTLKDLDLLENSYLIITGDHGIELMEHGDWGHGVDLYDELVHVPLIIVGPDIEEGKISDPVSLIDIPPTISDLLGLRKPESFMGRSLLEKDRRKGVFMENAQEKRRDFSTEGRKVFLDMEKAKYAYRTKKYKYIFSQDREELYNLKEDPEESQNIVGDKQKKRDKFREKILKHIEAGKKFSEKTKLKEKIDFLKNKKIV